MCRGRLVRYWKKEEVGYQMKEDRDGLVPDLELVQLKMAD